MVEWGTKNLLKIESDRIACRISCFLLGVQVKTVSSREIGPTLRCEKCRWCTLYWYTYVPFLVVNMNVSISQSVEFLSFQEFQSLQMYVYWFPLIRRKKNYLLRIIYRAKNRLFSDAISSQLRDRRHLILIIAVQDVPLGARGMELTKSAV